MLRLLAVKGGSRFIHNDEPRILRDRLDNFHHLRFCQRQTLHFHLGRRIKSKVVQKLLRSFQRGFFIQKRSVRILPVQIDIFCNRQIRLYVQLLMNHCHPAHCCLGRVFDVIGLTLKRDGSGILRMQPNDAFHQGGLTRAVFSHQRMYCSGADHHIHI
ncbi:hypothetical protein SDC9_66916 [bioreactor metagenome]|uniref:Uncharacterized protein n=1 Tax=bioreactor metagenome TaxID=1076179 RepID=A0A644XW64_9ZZZZ